MTILLDTRNGENWLVKRRVMLMTSLGLLMGRLDMDRFEAQEPESEQMHFGKPGDFDFLAGEWKIRNRRRKPGTDAWDEFVGEATCWTVLGGIGSIEELRIPAQDFSGIGIRLLDVKERLWSDHWVNGKSGVLTTPGQTGVFVDGVGTFTANWKDGDKSAKVKGIWDQITPHGCRWSQAISNDNGVTWEENWVMNWERVK